MKKLLVFVCTALFAIGCEDDTTGTDNEQGCLGGAAVDCACVRASVTDTIADPGDGNPVYRVVEPNGGEQFSVGDTMRIVVTSKLEGGAGLRVVFYRSDLPNGRRALPVPGTPDYALDPASECCWYLVIPDSLMDPAAAGGRISTVADSVKILVEDYEFANEYFDESDGFFRITDTK